ncbi:MAG: InlB B-repeat-containing protein [Tannerella sp.]|nr:InlB B-repeat-containing protein [Tannerella sp.]
MKKNILKTGISLRWLMTLTVLMFACQLRAQDAQMAVTATVSTASPQSNEIFELNITVGSQALGNVNIINGAVVKFDLPAHLDVAMTPQSDLFTVTQTGDTHVEVAFTGALPVGYSRSFKFGLVFEAGVSVNNVDATTLAITADATNCLQGTTNISVNPVNIALPTIMDTIASTGSAKYIHSTVIELTPEQIYGGLNHNNARVRIAIDKNATVAAIKVDDVVVSVTPTITTDSAIYIIPLGVLEAGEAKNRVQIFYAYPATPCPKTYVMTISYLADREHGVVDTPISEVLQKTENVACNAIGPVFLSTFSKTASDVALRMANYSLQYDLVFSPVTDVRNIVVIDNPILNEPDFFTVNRFTAVVWSGLATEVPPYNNTIKTVVSYEYSDAPGVWVTDNPTPMVSGSTSAFSTTNAKYVTRLKFEFFNASGGLVINALAGQVHIAIQAEMTAASATLTYIADNELNNSAYGEGDLYDNGAYQPIPTNGVDNLIQSETTLRDAVVASYWDYDGHYYSFFARSYATDETDNFWWVPRTIPMPPNASVKVGDEFWFINNFDVENIPLKDPVFMFWVPSSDFELVSVRAGDGVGDFTYTTYDVPGGGYIVKITLNGYHTRWNGSPLFPNNPFDADYWGSTGTFGGCTDIGIKLRVLDGATVTTLSGYSGTTNFDQPFGSGWGNGSDMFYDASGIGAAAQSSGAMAASTGSYWVFGGFSRQVQIDNSIGFHPEKTASLNGTDFTASVTTVNTTAQTVYYKLHIENTSDGTNSYDRVKIIDVLPLPSDKLALNDIAKGSDLALTGVSIASMVITDNLGVQTTLTIPDPNVLVYYSSTSTVAERYQELAQTSSSAGTWTLTTTGAIPNGSNAVKIDLTTGLPNDYKFDVILQGTLPAGVSPETAWNSMGVGAHSVSPSINLAPAEPVKSAVRRSLGTSKLSGLIWSDDGDGIRQATEAGIPNVIVSLYNSSDVLLTTTTTNAAGEYEFIGLDNALYIIKFTPPGSLQLAPYGVGSDPTKDCDFIMVSGLAMASRTINSADITHVDAGICTGSYSVTFVLQGGNIGGSTANVVFPVGTTLSNPSDPTSIVYHSLNQIYGAGNDWCPTPVKSHFTFAGWFDDAAGTIPTTLTTTTLITANRTVYAVWIANTCSEGFFVDKDVQGGLRDGSSWDNAFPTIEEALASAANGDFIWVAEGEYTPPAGTSYTMLFDEIEIYGGFKGDEIRLEERDFATHKTILKGNGSNLPIIDNANLTRAARWDGFVIENGRAPQGAGIRNTNASPIISNTIIRSNAATQQGGGVFNLNSAPLFYNVEISGNTAPRGAGIYNQSSDMETVNVTISGNLAGTSGGGVFNSASNPVILNTIIYDNRAGANPNIANEGSMPNFAYSIIEGSGGSANWNTAFGTDNSHNIDANPSFVQKGFDLEGKMQEGDYRLRASSAAVDAGRTAFVYNWLTRWNMPLYVECGGVYTSAFCEVVPFDLAFFGRISNDIVDMGAYEYDSEWLIDVFITRQVIIPEVEGIETTPGAGVYYVLSSHDFTFNIKAKSGYAIDQVRVAVNIPLRDREGLVKKTNADGSLTVTILTITEPINIDISDIIRTVDAENIASDRVWAAGGNLYVEAAQTSVLEIYNLSGSLIAKQKIGVGSTVIPLAAGFYVVRLNDVIYKIIAKN